MLNNTLLGKKVTYKSTYDAGLLFPIQRAINRATIGLNDTIPFHGVDIWNAYELSWLNEKGKPQVAIAEFIFPCDSKNMLESKAFKLYLDSFNQSHFVSREAVRNVLQSDLTMATKAKVTVHLRSVDSPTTTQAFPGFCLDSLDIDVDEFTVNPSLLFTSEQNVEERVYSNLLKSNCPVTAQPDFASVFIHYQGKQIEHTSLLKYLISFREHTEFNENCIERIFMDITWACQPEKLTVYGRYTRRGGLDINPFRSNFESLPFNFRHGRQ
jgi:7-cyano-7-deazaguanine reductase